MGTFRAVQNAAFDHFDPTLANTFDPNLAKKFNNANGAGGQAVTTVSSAVPGQKMQFNVTLNNPTAQKLTYELFCAINSFKDVLKTAYVVGNYKYIPLLSLEGLTAHAGTHGGVVGFDQTGNLQIQGDPSIPELAGTISCGEIPYQGLLKASAITPFMITYIRMTCASDPQIDQKITYFTQSYSGGQTENPVSPRSYFQPTQFQNFTIDITVEMGIDLQSGIFTQLLAGENVRYAFFVSLWAAQSIS